MTKCEDCERVMMVVNDLNDDHDQDQVMMMVVKNMEGENNRRRIRHNSSRTSRFNYIYTLGYYSLFVALLVLVISSSSCVNASSASSSVEEQNVVSQSEIKTIEPTNNPTKVFVRRRIFRKIVKEPSSSSASNEEPTTSLESTTTPRPRTLYSLVKRVDKETPSSTVTGSTLKSSMSTSVSLSSKQKFNFASLKTRLGLAATEMTSTSTTTSTTTTTEQPPAPPNNDSLVMIPLPPNQRKPYTPVIMQVTKSTTAKPTMQTYKLNKMFVPIGIYGKVLENGSEVVESASTPATEIRHKGTDSGEMSGGAGGASSNSGERKHKGIADTVDITYGKPNVGRYSLTTEKPDIGLISITTEANELFGGILDGVRRGDHHYQNSQGGNRNRQQSPYSNSGLTLMTPPKLGSSSDQDSPSTLSDSLSSYASYSSYSNSSPHKKFSPSAMLDSITDSMSKIPSLVPSLFHKGLTSLTSLTSSLKENPFVDDNFSESSPKKNAKPIVSGYTPKIPASVPGGYINGMGSSSNGGGGGSNSKDQVYAGSELSSGSGPGKGAADLSEYETLEYFRKRPYLLSQIQKQSGGSSSWRRTGKKERQLNHQRQHGSGGSLMQQMQHQMLQQKQHAHQNRGLYRMSKGFKPATAPDLLAREYYKSTSTTQMTPDDDDEDNEKLPQHQRKSKHMTTRGSWLLRNSNEYVTNKNERLVKMWRNMLDSFTNDDDETDYDDEEEQQQQQQQQQQTPSKSMIASRRSSSSSGGSRKSKSPILSSYWSSIKNKYSKDQINEAKERILTLLNSGYGDDTLLEEQLLDEEELQHSVGGAAPAPLPDYDDTASHMPPPPPPRIKSLSLTKGLSGAAAGAFKDLVKFFKLGVSVGAGQAREPVNYEKVVDLQEEEESDWKPVRRPLISFSAGISLKNPSSSSSIKKPHYHHYHSHPPSTTTVIEEEVVEEPDHYVSSSPVISSYSKPSLTSYIDEFASHHGHDPTSHLKQPVSYATYNSDIVSLPASASPIHQSIDYDEDPEGYESNTQSYVAEAPARYSTSRPANYYDYSTLKTSGTRTLQSWAPITKQVDPASEYELVPSSLYLNGQNDPRDIAAVVKPAGVSDDLVRQTLPAGLRNLRILDYPNEYASLNSISQALGSGGAGSSAGSGVGFKAAMKKLRENYVAKEASYLPPSGQVYGAGGLEEIEAPTTIGLQSSYAAAAAAAGLSGLTGLRGTTIPAASTVVPSYTGGYHAVSPVSTLQPTYFSPLSQQMLLGGNPGESVFATANRINNMGRGSSSSGVSSGLHATYSLGQQAQQAPQKDPLGFTTNYNLPSALDPDIAAILKSELDKDDIPDDVRQEFLEAKEQEKKQSQQQQASRRVDDAQQSLIDSLLNSAIEKSRAQAAAAAAAASSAKYTNPPEQYTPPSTPSTTPLTYYNPTQATPTHPTNLAQSRSYQYNNNVAPPPPPHHHHHHHGPPPMPHSPPVVATRFFAPIPITPTLMTMAMRNPRYSSPVPRYVIELANKLQRDKSVQGIVRVSAKRGRGLPPIEYLYPVKG